MGELIYNIIILPIEYLMDALLYKLYRVYMDPIIALIFFSVIINLLTLPLYRRAEEIQAKERDKNRKLESWVQHIRKNFRSDERNMMLWEYYRISGYNPFKGLTTVFPILLQVPFFIAAYRYLSANRLFSGVSAFGITDLAYPDALLHIGDHRLNALPFIMTAVNMLSGLVWCKEDLKGKIRTLIIPLVFLGLLYDCPAVLLVYWTISNTFSLIRNVLDRYASDKKILKFVLFSIPALHYFFVQYIALGKGDWWYNNNLFFFILLMPVVWFIVRSLKKQNISENGDVYDRLDTGVTIVSLIALTVYFGGAIPSMIISASPDDFIDPYFHASPFIYITHTMSVYSGVFIFFGGLITYLLKGEKARKYILILCSVMFASVFNMAAYGKEYGSLNSSLVHDGIVRHSGMGIIINCMIMAGIYIVVRLFYHRYRKWIAGFMGIVIITSLVMILYCRMRLEDVINAPDDPITGSWEELKGTAVLDRNAENVLFIMLDRAIGAYVPYILNENPGLMDKFDGFTYYPDTLSYGWKTAIGSPALFGGYEYLPEEIDKRDEELLVDKQNEALSVMPVLFGEAGWHVSVYDPPFAGYSAIPDISIYNEYPYINAYNFEGKFNGGAEIMAGLFEQRKRYFVSYSVMRTAPVLFAEELYDNGNYMTESSATKDLSVSFLHYYHELEALPEITRVSDSGQGGFVMMDNRIAHEPSLLQMPEYKPAGIVDNSGYDMSKRMDADGNALLMDSEWREAHYCSNMAAYLLLGEYFDWMREQGVYDNTRIIVAADHGHPMGQLENMLMIEGRADAMAFNPVFMFKDFGSKGFVISDDFMTNADAPLMAMEGLGFDLINPFTKKIMNNNAKNEVLHVCGTEDLNGYNESGDFTRFQSDDRPWYSVHDSMLDKNNWAIWKEAGER